MSKILLRAKLSILKDKLIKLIIKKINLKYIEKILDKIEKSEFYKIHKKKKEIRYIFIKAIKNNEPYIICNRDIHWNELRFSSDINYSSIEEFNRIIKICDKLKLKYEITTVKKWFGKEYMYELKKLEEYSGQYNKYYTDENYKTIIIYNRYFKEK